MHGKHFKIDGIQDGRHPVDGNRKTAIIMYLIMIQSSVIHVLVPASHKAFNGHCVDFVKPSTNQIATISMT